MMCCIRLGAIWMKEELLQMFWKWLAIIIIIGIVICSIASLSYPKAFDISFIKDIYGILFTIFAAYTAIYLFNDWKVEKNFDTDVELLKACDENIIRFKKDLDIICNKIIKIYKEYENKKNYYIAHSLYKKNLELESQYLDDFFIHISRYLNFHEDKNFSLLVNEYYSISTEILYINKDFVTEIYKPIYEEIKKYSSVDLVDSTLLISFPPNQEVVKIHLTQKHKVLRTNYINTGYLTEINKDTNKEEDRLLNYEEYYELMNDYYSNINTYIKEKIRA